jgi:hypothetical protein
MLTPIGISDFRTLIEYRDPFGNPYLFIDKSLLVKKILSDSHVILITRPRRFGKTLNMSLLHHFFAKEVMGHSTHHLFENLEIFKHKNFMQYQGKYPVIFFTFKDIKGENFEQAYSDLKELIKKIYKEHEQAIYDSKTLTENDKLDYQAIIMREASDALIKVSLYNLTQYLTKAYGVKPIVLIDEYDTPIQAAYVHKYYKSMLELMRSFLSAGLKDNSYLEKAILTGILKVSKESIFSGLNHLSVYTLLDSRYGEFFGFTKSEVSHLFHKAEINNTLEEVTEWYNGYHAGELTIFNPWSIINYIKEKGTLKPYWINTSDNAILKNLFIQSSLGFKIQFETLFQEGTIEKLINENFSFESLEKNESALWTLFLMTGYLTIISTQKTEQGSFCTLDITNKEVKGLLKTIIGEWLSGMDDATLFNHFLNEFLKGNVTYFEEHLKNILLQTCSIHDLSGKNPEKFYHGFLLGLLSGIDTKQYRIDSNKEAGLGRYDILIAPYNPNQLAIIIELKSLNNDNQQALQDSAAHALLQIESKKYHQSTALHQTKQLLKIGIAFSGKKLAIAHTTEIQRY